MMHEKPNNFNPDWIFLLYWTNIDIKYKTAYIKQVPVHAKWCTATSVWIWYIHIYAWSRRGSKPTFLTAIYRHDSSRIAKSAICMQEQISTRHVKSGFTPSATPLSEAQICQNENSKYRFSEKVLNGHPKKIFACGGRSWRPLGSKRDIWTLYRTVKFGLRQTKLFSRWWWSKLFSRVMVVRIIFTVGFWKPNYLFAVGCMYN